MERIRQSLWYWGKMSFVLVTLVFFLDFAVMEWLAAHRVDGLDEVMVFLTDVGLLFGVLLFGVALFEKHWWKLLFLTAVSFIAALEASMLLKQLFQTPRPYETLDGIALDLVSGYSFPSMHAAFIFSALPFFAERKLYRYRWAWMAFAVAVAMSRVYVGVHYLSDVVAGALLGYGIGWLLREWEAQHHLAERFLHLLKTNFEVRRQMGHALVGLGIVALLFFDLLTPQWLLVILMGGGALAMASRSIDIPGIKTLLDLFERPHLRRHFPGKGSFFLIFGALLAIVFFPKTIALAAITIMAVGDSATNVLGRFFGKSPLPYNSRKTIEGAMMAVGLATLGAMTFVPFTVALLASAAAMFVETLDLKIGVELDDNVLVPLVAGGVMIFVDKFTFFAF